MAENPENPRDKNTRQKADLSQEQLQYYDRIEGIIESDELDDNDDGLFVQNVLKQVVEDGASSVFANKRVSKIVESMLQKLTIPPIASRQLAQTVSDQFLALSTDKCAGHVVEACLTRVIQPACQLEWQAEVAKQEDNNSTAASDAVCRICDAVKANVELFLCDQYASHVLRTLLQVLAGVTVCEQVNRSRYSHEFRKCMLHKGVEYTRASGGGRQSTVESVRPTSQLFLDLLKRLCRRAIKLEKFGDMLAHPNASPVIQTLLVILMQKLPKRGLKLCHQIIGIAGVKKGDQSERDVIPEQFTNPVGSHLMGVLIELCSAETHQTIYNSCFRHQVMAFALHPVANYTLQQLIATSDVAQISMIIEELDLERVLFSGHMGVVVKIAEACKECPSRQAGMVISLLKAFHTESDPKDCTQLLIPLVAREVYYKSSDSDQEEEVQQPKAKESKYPCTLHGALLVQALLNYEDTKLITSSLLRTPQDQLLSLACDPSGSHVVDTFLSSRNVHVKKKTKLIKMFMGHFVRLSKEKHGSRVVDCCWKHTELKDKNILADELIKGERELADNYYGKFVLRNCSIEHYKKKGSMKENGPSCASKEKVKKMFSDIIGTLSAEVKKSKRKLQSDGQPPGGAGIDFAVKKKKQLFEDSDEEQ